MPTDVCCSTPGCCELVQPWANDGDMPYRTEDAGGKCAWCCGSAICPSCGSRFECADPSDPDLTQCPDCAADRGGIVCDHTNSTCATCERH